MNQSRKKKFSMKKRKKMLNLQIKNKVICLIGRSKLLTNITLKKDQYLENGNQNGGHYQDRDRGQIQKKESAGVQDRGQGQMTNK
jgi:hypothetical protein